MPGSGHDAHPAIHPPSAIATPPVPQTRLFYGWHMMARVAVLRALSGGLHIFGFSVFFLPITESFGLSRAATSLVFSLSKVEGAFEGPIAGHFIDRLGPRVVIIVGCALAGLGYLLLSQSSSFVMFAAIYVLVITVGASIAFQHGAMAVANNWFIRRRAIAMALISSAVALGGAFFTPLLSRGIYGLGWRWGAALVGMTFLAVGLPMAWGLRSRPESVGLRPLGYGEVSADSGQPAGSTDSSVKGALRSAALWTLVIASILRLFGFNAILVHFIPILVWKGIAETTAAIYLSALAFLGMGTHLFMGWLADRWPKPRVLALGMASGVVSATILLYSSPGLVWLALPFFVPVEALFPVTWATVGEFFGRRRFGTIRGLITMFWAIGPIAGPVIAGRVFDSTGSYALALQLTIASFALSAVTFYLIRSPQRQRHAP